MDKNEYQRSWRKNNPDKVKRGRKNYYKNNKLDSIKYKVDKNVVKFTEDLKRYERTFMTILKYVSEYSRDQNEFDMLTKELYDCYLRYQELINKGATT